MRNPASVLGRVQVRQGVEGDQCVALGVEDELGHRAVANAHIELNRGLGRGAQNMAHSGGNRATAGDHQHVARALRANVGKRAGHALLKFLVARHAVGADNAVHPLREAVAQEPKVVAVKLGRVGFFQFMGVNGGNHRFAVVFIQARPIQRHAAGLVGAHAFANAFERLLLSRQSAGQHSVKADAFALEIFTQTDTLLVAQRA